MAVVVCDVCFPFSRLPGWALAVRKSAPRFRAQVQGHAVIRERAGARAGVSSQGHPCCGRGWQWSLARQRRRGWILRQSRVLDTLFPSCLSTPSCRRISRNTGNSEDPTVRSRMLGGPVAKAANVMRVDTWWKEPAVICLEGSPEEAAMGPLVNGDP